MPRPASCSSTMRSRSWSEVSMSRPYIVGDMGRYLGALSRIPMLAPIE